MKLRSYQLKGVQDIHNAFATSKDVLFVCPTGGGKSVIIAEIVLRAVAKGSTVHIRVHRDKLLQQLEDRIAPLLADCSVGWVKSGRPINPDAQVQLVSIQSWRSRKDKIPAPQLIITDEAHRAKAATYLESRQYYPEAYSLGVTATPCTLAGAGLGAAYDAIVNGPQMLWLTEQKFLSPIEYLPFDPLLDPGRAGASGEFQLAKIGKKVKPQDYAPAAIAAYNQYIPGKQTLVFCIDIAHARGVAEAYTEAGIPSGVFTSDQTDDENNKVLQGFISGQLLCLMSVEIFNEGVDIPALDAIQMLRPTDSLRIFLQQIGRVVRYVEGKIGYVLDHVGNHTRHGHPLAPRRWTLEGELGELERKEKNKRSATPPVEREWRSLGFTPMRAQKLTQLDESGYWANWLRVHIAEIEKKGWKPATLAYKFEKAELNPPWPVYEAVGTWLKKHAGYKNGWAWHSYYRRYGFYPNDRRKPAQHDWQDMLKHLKPQLTSNKDF
jgi:DNA repair protein RadD